jgi:hypothetical protein
MCLKGFFYFQKGKEVKTVMKDELSVGALTVRTAHDLIHLPERNQTIVIKKLYESSDEEKRRRLHYISYKSAYPAERTKIENWMESTFTGNMKYIPKRVAHICVNCFRIRKTMLPQYISLAQKVKRRIICREIMRRKKHGGSVDEAG